MKAQEQIKNDGNNTSLTDLPVTDEQAGQTNGGRTVGSIGNDYLVGGDGRDYLIGGAGLDVLIGNTGGDR